MTEALAFPDALCPDAGTQISSLALAVLLLDPNLVIAQANPASEDMLSQSARRLVGARLFDVIDLSKNALKQRIEEGSRQITARGITIGISGEERGVNLMISPVQGFAGWSVLTISNAGQRDLEHDSAHDSPLKVPAILSHEIKNPLAAIKGAGQLIGRKLAAEDQALVKLITDEVDRIASLLDRMQHLGRELVEPLRPVNLHEAIHKSIANVRAGTEADIAITEEFDPSLPLVLANSDTLEQILINLISNARDAALESENPRIKVRTRFVSGLKTISGEGNGAARELPVEIAIFDNGAGFAPGLEEHIFEPFVTSKRGGQGLGLALVKKLVRDSGGIISARRNHENGQTIFRLNLAVSPHQAGEQND